MKKSLVKHRIKSFAIIAPYTIKIEFEDGARRTINFKPITGYGMYRPLRDPEFFNKVFISDGMPTLTWPNGADFNPDHLYDWPEYEKLYIERLRGHKKIQTESHS